MNFSKPVVLIDSFKLEGHHEGYLEYYYNQLSRLGLEIKILVADSKDADRIARRIMSIDDKSIKYFKSHFAISFLTKLNAWIRLQSIESLIFWLRLNLSLRQFKINKPYIPFILWFPLKYANNTQLSHWAIPQDIVILDGLSINPTLVENMGFDVNFTVNNSLYRSSSIKSILLLNEEACRYYQSIGITNCYWLPEAILLKKNELQHSWLINEIKELPLARNVVLYVGGLSQRKKEILGFCRLASKYSEDSVSFLAVGSLYRDHFTDEEFNQYLELKNTISNLFIIEKRACDEELYDLLELSNTVFLVYPNHPYSSSFMTMAISAGRSVIVKGDSLMARRAGKYGIGITYEELMSNPDILLMDRVEEDKIELFRHDHSDEVIQNTLTRAFGLRT
ncbi:MAG: hypothetical protein RLO81_05480 [Fulvivirga sp.]|uniref:hypothetical protein n=1 Tax=Fulvivirga sp. TaxID=1931237 RepID=UPI0032EF2FD1